MMTGLISAASSIVLPLLLLAQAPPPPPSSPGPSDALPAEPISLPTMPAAPMGTDRLERMATLRRDADAAMRGGNLAEAKVFLEELRLISAGDAADPRLAYNLGICEFAEGRFAAAAERFAEASRSRDPRLARDAMFNQGNARYRRGIEELQATVPSSPASPSTTLPPPGTPVPNPSMPPTDDLEAEIEATRRAIEWMEKASTNFRDALRSDPSDRDARANAEIVHRALKDLRQALADLERQKRERDEQQQQQSEQNQSEQNQSERNQSEQNQSEQNQSERNQSERNQSERNQSEQNQSEQNQSEQNQSEQNQSERNQSEQNQSEQNQSEQNQSEQNQSERTQPQDRQSENQQGEEQSGEQQRQSSLEDPPRQGNSQSEQSHDQTSSQSEDQQSRQQGQQQGQQAPPQQGTPSDPSAARNESRQPPSSSPQGGPNEPGSPSQQARSQDQASPSPSSGASTPPPAVDPTEAITAGEPSGRESAVPEGPLTANPSSSPTGGERPVTAPTNALSREQAEKLLQLIRDKEQQRRSALAAERRAQRARTPVRQDW